MNRMLGANVLGYFIAGVYHRVWRADRGLRDANCVRCFFRIREEIARSAAAYRSAFGTVPGFRGGLHGGTVVTGELGDLKQEIVFVGDILDTAARLELPDGLEVRFLEELAPRGKERTIAIHSLAEASR
jgi:hypothetical protein